MFLTRQKKRMIASQKLTGLDKDRFSLVNEALNDIELWHKHCNFLIISFTVILSLVGYFTDFDLDYFLLTGLCVAIVYLLWWNLIARYSIHKAIGQLRLWYHDPRKEFANVFQALTDDKTLKTYWRGVIEKYPA